MQHPHYDKQFADQFRHEYIAYPCFAEEQYQYLLYRQFAGHDNEIAIIGEALINRISDVDTIRSLMVQLGQKNIPDAFNLSYLLREVRTAFYACIRKEPYTASYFYELLANLQPFYLLVDSLQKRMECLLTKLACILLIEMDVCQQEAFYNNVKDIMDEIEVIEKDINGYYYYFYECLDRELENSRGVAQASHVELYLLQLVSYTEALIISLENLLQQNGKWNNLLLDLEAQEMNN